MDILLDASAIMAVILNEPNKDVVIRLTKSSTLLSPEMIVYETGNALISLYKRHKLRENEVIEAYNSFKRIPIRLLDVNMEKVLEISCKYRVDLFNNHLNFSVIIYNTTNQGHS